MWGNVCLKKKKKSRYKVKHLRVSQEEWREVVVMGLMGDVILSNFIWVPV